MKYLFTKYCRKNTKKKKSKLVSNVMHRVFVHIWVLCDLLPCKCYIFVWPSLDQHCYRLQPMNNLHVMYLVDCFETDWSAPTKMARKMYYYCSWVHFQLERRPIERNFLHIVAVLGTRKTDVQYSVPLSSQCIYRKWKWQSIATQLAGEWKHTFLLVVDNADSIHPDRYQPDDSWHFHRQL